jgi:hypothetical protein
MARNYDSLNTALASYRKGRDRRTPLSIQSVTMVTPAVARVIAGTADIETATEKDYTRTLSSLFEQKVRLAPGTLSNVSPDSAHEVVSMIVLANAPRREAHDDESYKKAVAGMSVVTANVFTDGDAKIWKLVGDGESRSLVQESSDDLEKLLLARNGGRFMSTASAVRVKDLGNFRPGDYVMYYSPEHASCRFGYGLNYDGTPTVFDRKSEKLVKVTAAAVIEVAEIHDKDYKVAIASRLERGDAAKYLDYMSNLYKGTSYFTRLEKLVREGVSIDGKGA